MRSYVQAHAQENKNLNAKLNRHFFIFMLMVPCILVILVV